MADIILNNTQYNGIDTIEVPQANGGVAQFNEYNQVPLLYDNGEGILYRDSGLTQQVETIEAIELFRDGKIVISVDDGLKRPTGINVTEEGYEVSYSGNGGGSGQEEFVITFTKTDENWSADKNFSDIEAAVAAGKKVVAMVDADGDPNKIEMKFYYPGEAALFFGLALFGHMKGISIIFTSENTVDEVEIYDFLPTVTSDDNGDVLMVDDGEWKIRALPSANAGQ